jgi:hypothetical protein
MSDLRRRVFITLVGCASARWPRVLGLTLLLAGCGLLQDSAKDPWQGYAWLEAEKRFEWLLVASVSHRECLKEMQNHLHNTEDGRRYSVPWGCGYHGSSYLRAWFLNFVYPGQRSDFECIARYGVQGSEEDYGPLLKGNSGRQSPSGVFYCI